MATSTSMLTAQASPRYVEANINYFPEEGGTTSYVVGSAAFWNRKFAPTMVQIEDIRGREAEYSLTKQGFQLVGHESKLGDFQDEARIRDFYYQETENLIQNVTGATKVKGFSHEVRSAELGSVLKDIDKADKSSGGEAPRKVAPAMYAHIDNGPLWARALFERVLGPEEAQRLCGCRWAIINVWRPIKPITRNPLGFCDTSTVEDDDLVPVHAKLTSTWGNPTTDLSDIQTQVYNVKANTQHRWYFASGMQPDEVLFLTIFDTNKTVDGHPRRVVHSAFPYVSEEGSLPRESIEFRSLVVWEDQKAEEN